MNENIVAKVVKEKESEVKNYFEKLGYWVTWDFNARSREQWWELYADELVAQIDMGVPLIDILEDLCQFHLGKDGTSKSDYKINGHGPKFDELLRKVYEDCHYRTPNREARLI